MILPTIFHVSHDLVNVMQAIAVTMNKIVGCFEFQEDILSNVNCSSQDARTSRE